MDDKQIPVKKTRMKIVGLGASMLDIIIKEDSETIDYSAGGTCGNVLAGLAIMGWEAVLIARVGKDYTAKILMQDLITNSIDVDFVTQETSLRTPRIIEKLSNNGRIPKHGFLLRCPRCDTYLPRFRSPKTSLIMDILETHSKPDVFFFDKVTPSSLRLAKAYRDAGALIFFEPEHPERKNNMEEAVGLSHIVKYARSETSQRTAVGGGNYFLPKNSKSLPKLVIETHGSHGLSYKMNNGECYNRPSFFVENVVDSCGAGDWCTTGFLFKLALLSQGRNITLEETLTHYELVDSAITYSQIMSSLSCKFVGAQGMSHTSDKDDILSIVDNVIGDNSKILSSGESYSIASKKDRKSTLKLENMENVCPVCLSDV